MQTNKQTKMNKQTLNAIKKQHDGLVIVRESSSSGDQCLNGRIHKICKYLITTSMFNNIKRWTKRYHSKQLRLRKYFLLNLSLGHAQSMFVYVCDCRMRIQPQIMRIGATIKLHSQACVCIGFPNIKLSIIHPYYLVMINAVSAPHTPITQFF